MIKPAGLAVLLGLWSAQAMADGCPPPDGVVIPEIEALNQQILDQDFQGLARAVQDQTGMNVTEGLTAVAQAYPAGFTGCTTVAQRIDTGGMVQAVVMYHRVAGPLFGYWRSATVNGEWALLSFTVNSGADSVMDKLR